MQIFLEESVDPEEWALLEEVNIMKKLQKKCYIEGLKSGEFGIEGGNDEFCYETKYLVRCLIARDFIWNVELCVFSFVRTWKWMHKNVIKHYRYLNSLNNLYVYNVKEHIVI